MNICSMAVCEVLKILCLLSNINCLFRRLMCIHAHEPPHKMEVSFLLVTWRPAKVASIDPASANIRQVLFRL